MLDLLPIRVWLLILIALCAFVPARYAWRHVTDQRSRQWKALLADAPDRGATLKFALSLAALAGLAALAVFIHTPAAVRFAHWPRLPALLLSALGAWGLVSVAIGLSTGRIQPAVRGARSTYERERQPARFWSVLWNTLLSGVCLWAGLHL
ncbi:hypothetical protein [Caulobacter sp. 17J65-9]|uniref:hypothetical protein n=1 Tax=Caulobacter sp. 17J65-9 TaxID=2709382 RepID=UPI0013C70F47|nr:hypothetical protein [Caulobacter sp. 17J65-9]NEX93808.1 hypothetical protein [Caulobacter sp. 17J65-9]